MVLRVDRLSSIAACITNNDAIGVVNVILSHILSSRGASQVNNQVIADNVSIR